MISRKSHLFFLIVLAVLILPLTNVQAKITSEITGIEVREVDGTTEIEIKSTTPLTYTMYTSDPYRIVLEMQNTALKGLKKKVFDKSGVMEIIPASIEGVPDAAKLEISLTDPVDVKPIQKGGSLLLTFDTPAKASEAEEEKASGAEETHASGKVIENIALSKSGGKLLITISGNAEMIAKVLNADNNKLVIDIPDFTTAIDAPRVFEPPVLGIRIGKHSDKTRLVFDLAGPSVYDISPSGTQLTIAFNIPGAAETPSAAEKAGVPVPVVAENQEAQEVKSLCDSGPGQYSGEKINLDMQDADLIHIFRLIADVSGCNVVVSPQVSGKFSMRLIDVPWDQALDVILRNYGLDKMVEGNIIRIAKVEEIKKIIKEQEEIKKAREAGEETITETFELKYTSAEDVRLDLLGGEKSVKEDQLTKTSRIEINYDEKRRVLSSKGMAIADFYSNRIVVTDIPSKMNDVRYLIAAWDKPKGQVQVEARVVEVSTNFTQEFGIQWGANIRPSVDTQIGGLSTTGTGSTGFSSGNPLLINLPAAAGLGSGGAIGFGYLGAGLLRSLDLQLSAMEDTGNGKIISNPRIITVDNRKAKIVQGRSIPYSSVSANGTETKFVDANLQLIVTPRILPSGKIEMSLEIKNDEADFGAAVNGQPSITTKQAETQVLIMDGDTLVIGGVFKTKISENENKLPGIGNVPVLGWLFKKERNEQKSEEVLIFITPSIVR